MNVGAFQWKLLFRVLDLGLYRDLIGILGKKMEADLGFVV